MRRQHQLWGRRRGLLAEDLDCVNVGAGHPYTNCAVSLSERSAGEASIPVPAF
ncbi:MAG: hypothetical protein JNJ59_07300 [Deltaproteobacteria bacterium]|nr:hypothetical protein [Deltaproteobacteria bacterium]